MGPDLRGASSLIRAIRNPSLSCHLAQSCRGVGEFVVPGFRSREVLFGYTSEVGSRALRASGLRDIRPGGVARGRVELVTLAAGELGVVVEGVGVDGEGFGVGGRGVNAGERYGAGWAC